MDGYEFLKTIYYIFMIGAILYFLVSKTTQSIQNIDKELWGYRFFMFKQKWKESIHEKIDDFKHKDTTTSFQSQTTNTAVLELYEFIIEYENYDSSFWDDGNGACELVQILDDYFTDQDWIDLKEDLEHWTIYQLEILSGAILNPCHQVPYEPGQQAPELEALIDAFVYQRFLLILPLLNIANDRGRYTNEVYLYILENLDYICSYYDILLKYDPNINAKIEEIIERLECHNDPIAILLKQRMENE